MKKNLLSLTICAATATNAFAFLGAGDVVIVASNPAQELLWASKELPKWLEMIDTAKKQVDQAQEMIDLVGNPEKFAAKLIDTAEPLIAATKAANAIQSSAEVLEFAERSWKLYKGAEKVGKDVLAVGQDFQVMGETIKRNPLRYLDMVKEKALRTRVKEVVKLKQENDAKELDYQEAMVDALRRATTQTEIAFHQAALAASKQRMDLLAARVAQAETELQTYMGDAVLERKKDLEQVQEKSEAEVAELRRRMQDALQHTGANLDSM